ncbi:MAG: response regulator [Eubacteriaceae bacterium]|jgi:two-component system LytT family response regulator|nr:response regulator [Eubacteriaceae bacterium]MDD4508435.1 response regulator [Eubacteriaceae bacterium]
MNILAVDNEKAPLHVLVRAIEAARPEANLQFFQKPSEAVEAIESKTCQPDVAFLDIEMPGITGLDFSLIIKKYNPKANIIFVTGYSQYALKAMELHSSGYILKPATEEKIDEELKHLRDPVTAPSNKKVNMQCFGTFEVFVDGTPIHFARLKSKEMLAFLVDRHGANCPSAEIANALWDDGIYDRSRQKQLSVIRRDLIKSLKASGVENIIKKSRGVFAVDPEIFDCDYYNALNGDPNAINQFMGNI